MNELTKTCIKCKEAKPRDLFNVSAAATKDGLRRKCKACEPNLRIMQKLETWIIIIFWVGALIIGSKFVS